MKEYLVQFRIKNNYLHKLMEHKGIESLAELSRRANVGYPWIVELSNLKARVINKEGYPTQRAMRLSEFFNCLPEDLAPEKHLHYRMEKTVTTREASDAELVALIEAKDVNVLPTPEDACFENDRKKLIDEALATLTPRERNVIRLRFGFDGDPLTFDETAEAEGRGVSRERIRQIEAKALRKLKHPSKSSILREVA